MENSLPISGRATLTDEPIKGARNDVTVASMSASFLLGVWVSSMNANYPVKHVLFVGLGETRRKETI